MHVSIVENVPEVVCFWKNTELICRYLEKTGYTNRNRLMVAAVSKRLVVPSSQLDV